MFYESIQLQKTMHQRTSVQYNSVKSVMRPSAAKEVEMRKSIYGLLRPAVLLAAFIILTACVVMPAGRRGPGVVIVPPLPSIVVLGQEPYYYQSGYYYYYQNNNWFYSNTKSGPWVDLPRGHYPKEIRFKGRDDDGDRDWKHGDDEGDKGWKRRNEDNDHH